MLAAMSVADRLQAARPAGARAPLTRRLSASSVGAALAVAGVLAAGLAIALAAAAGPSFLVPSGRHHFPGWLAGPLAALGGDRLSPGGFGALVTAMCACYLAALALARSVPARWGLAAIAGLHVVFLLAPPLLTTDPFGYLAYARVGALDGLSPYLHGTKAARADPVHAFFLWDRPPSPYGALFTLATYPLAPLGLAAGLWTLKAAAAGASLGCVALVWSWARRTGRDPVPPALFLGLNPVVLVWAVGGAHNDVVMAFLALAGLALVAGWRREGRGAAALVGAAAVKVPAAVALPFALVATRRRGAAVAGAAAAALAFAALAAGALGGRPEHAFGVLGPQGGLASDRTIPYSIGRLLGLGGATQEVRLAAAGVLAASVAALLVRTWRGADPVAGAGWAVLALLVTSAWLMPWYAVWLVPLAAVAGSRRLRHATLALCAFIVATRVSLPVG